MAGKIYFQWQNPFLRDTIYTSRNLKLRHFLLYYKEFDLWAEYKDKQIKDLRKEVEAYEKAQRTKVTGAFEAEKKLRQYFLEPALDLVEPAEGEPRRPFAALVKRLAALEDPEAREDKELPREDVKDLRDRMKGLHDAFDKVFRSYEQLEDKQAQDRKEKLFVAMRIAEWEQYYKNLKQTTARRRSLLAGMHKESVGAKTKQVEALEQVILPGVEAVLDNLRDLVAAQTRLEARKAEYDKRQKDLAKKREKIDVELIPLEKAIRELEARKRAALKTIARLQSSLDFDDTLQYFSQSRLTQEIREYLTQGRVPASEKVVKLMLHAVDSALEDTFGSLVQELLPIVAQWDKRGRNNAEGILLWIKAQMSKFDQTHKQLDKAALILESRAKNAPEGSGERTNYLLAVNSLLDAGLRDLVTQGAEKLEDLRAALMSPEQREKLLAENQASLPGLERALKEKTASARDLQQQLQPIQEDLELTRDVFLQQFVKDRAVDLKKDILPFLAEQYHEELKKLDHDQLLERIFERFYREPERFPLWLQYMVVHFSGMRYASAHGSWADPREMLLSLRTLDLQNEGTKSIGDDEIMGRSEGLVEIFTTNGKERGGARASASLSPLLRAAETSRTLKEKLESHYIPRLKSIFVETRRRALLELAIEEEKCKIYEMKPEEVLEHLKTYEDKIPDWMWKEIVKLTDLRLTEVESANWETLTPEEQEERLSNQDRQMGKYREIMNQWKEKNLTGWRQEHDRSNRLIVTRAVCNEVAEHIQHLRGHTAASGLTNKPDWYTRAEKEYFANKERVPGPHPYFVRAKGRNDFEVGASILWLRFVHDSPNQWRIAKPMTTRAGDGLIAKHYLGRKPESGGWVYQMGEPTSRTRMKIDTSKKKSKPGPKETQYLRWMHEATVAAVEETHDGWVVLTFETALPYDEPSASTIGVVKHHLDDLIDDRGEDAYFPAFVGYLPQGELPVDDLEGMLNWNHILLKDCLSPAEWDAYRKKYIRGRKPPAPTIQFMAEREAAAKPNFAALPICDFVKWTDQLASDPNKPNLYKVRVWGDPAPAMKDFDVKQLEKQGVNSNFQAVGLYNRAYGRGGVKNFIVIGREDIDRLKAMQIEDEYEHKYKRKDWRSQKMDWLCKGEGTVFFTNDGPGWQTAKTIKWGTVAIGGNLVQVEWTGEVEFKIGKKWVALEMARLAGFRRKDWGRPLDELIAEGLVHRCFCVMARNRPADTPKGIIYSPFFSVQERAWDFAGREQPNALYLPLDQLVKPDPADPNYHSLYHRLQLFDQCKE